MGIIDYLFHRKSSESSLILEDLYKDTAQHAMKSIALETCANYIARTFAKAHFVFQDGEKKEKAWGYRINHLPNPNESAAEFWSNFVKRYITEGEALVYINARREMFLVESYIQKKDLTGDTFQLMVMQGVAVNIYARRDEVLFLKAENERLDKFTDSLWSDYGAIMGRLFQNQKRIDQLRFTMDIPKYNARERARELANRHLNSPLPTGRQAEGEEKKTDKQKDLIMRLTNRLENDGVVPIMLPDRAKYEEFQGQNGVKKTYVDDISKMKTQYINDVADILGIPNGLIHGELADNQQNYETFLATVIEPIAKKIVDALNYIIFDRSETTQGKKIRIVGFRNYDMFELSASIDKLISSGAVTHNEIRLQLGMDKIPDGDIFMMTKNYERFDRIGSEQNEKVDT